MKSFSIVPALLVAGLIGGGVDGAFAGDVPGTVAGDVERTMPGAKMPRAFGLPETASGLKVFYEKYGKYRLSVAAVGSNNASHQATIVKPTADAVVDKAFVMAASYLNTPIPNGSVTIDGQPITWIEAVTNDIPPSLLDYFHSVRADVTSLVKAKIDAAPAGNVSFTFTEGSINSKVDGETLVVVFSVPSTTARRTVSLLFGGQQLSGDRFELTLNQPFDKNKRGAVANMGLGISFSYQGGGTQQYSIIDVNGNRLSTAAGGEDDGTGANGALITAGGVGDSQANPVNPSATPTNARSDDEAYSLKSRIGITDKVIRVDTSNPSNDDNIFFAWFEISVSADVNADTDGDGLLDSWERYGYDHDGNGTIDVDLPALGANYRKKDIFVAYAWMQASPSETKSHQPLASVLNEIRNSFAIAPVSNPDGTTGINLHFINKGSVAHDNDLNPVWDEFDALMDPKVTEAERKVFHRMLNAHGYGGGSSSGLSRGIPASDFIESLGLWPSNPGTTKERAGTIMHELGHNLGLRHGGVDHENYKPNHLSIMSYFNQVAWVQNCGGARLDYERFDLKPLDENNLNEINGLDRVGGDTPIRPYGARWYAGGIARNKSSGANRNVNWNASGAATDIGVAVDLNNSGAKSVLNAGFIEWKNIVYDGGDIGAGAGREAKANQITSPQDLIELTYEEYLLNLSDPIGQLADPYEDLDEGEVPEGSSEATQCRGLDFVGHEIGVKSCLK